MRPKPAPLSPTEYLDREEKSPVKSEYVNGEIYTMSGAKRAHNLIASNLVYRARGAAIGRHSGCQVFGSDMKVYVEAHSSFYYPDLSVCCDPSDRHDRFVARPCFIVEVLSPSTALIDRREKRASYTTERQEDATQRRRLRSTVKQSRLLPITLAHAALVPAL